MDQDAIQILLTLTLFHCLSHEPLLGLNLAGQDETPRQCIRQKIIPKLVLIISLPVILGTDWPGAFGSWEFFGLFKGKGCLNLCMLMR